MKRYKLPISISLFVFSILAIIQIKVSKPLLLLERFFEGGGWIQILILSAYGFLVSYKMQNPQKTFLSLNKN